MPDNEKGLYEKYNVTRTDGSPIKGCFVIEFKDPHARIALNAYADSVEMTNPELAQDLRTATRPSPRYHVRSMETAPRDGKPILLLTNGYEKWEQGSYTRNIKPWSTVSRDCLDDKDFYGWMPLPGMENAEWDAEKREWI